MKNFQFYLFLSLSLIISCNTSKNNIQLIESQNININSDINSDVSIENFIRPFREHINADLNIVLAQNLSDMVKQNKNLNMPIGNFFSEAAYQQSQPIFKEKTGKTIDFVMFNWGGIRSDLPKGDVTIRSIFELMPFENKLWILELKGEQIFELAHYLIKEKQPHPLSKHFELHFNKNNEIISLKINQKNVEKDKTYWVCTTDYLANGGDKMDFFKKAISIIDINYKLRKALIDYFSKNKQIYFESDNRLKQLDNE